MKKWLKGTGKTKGKGKGKGAGKGKDKNETWHTTTPDGKPICYRYNSAGRTCTDKCGRVHCCQRCLGKHPVYECPQAA